MTMVAACAFHDGAVILSDSRVTSFAGLKKISDDTAQKIVKIGPRTALGFAGSVYLAAKVIEHLRTKAKSDERRQNVRKVAADLPRIAKHFFRTHRDHAKHGLSIILAGVERPGTISVFCYKSPDFQQHEVKNDFVIIGSGEVARPYLHENFSKINTPENSLKQKADMLNRGLDFALREYKAEYVGGLLQVIVISAVDIRPLQHYSVEIDPVATSNYSGMRMQKGRWIQEAKGQRIILSEPEKVLRTGVQERRLYDYSSAPFAKDSKYHLSYFVTCLAVERTASNIAFRGILSQIGSTCYPRIIPVIACVGFWGPSNEQDLRFTIDDGTETKMILSEKVGGWYFPERFEIDTKLDIEVSAPGPIFLNCFIGENLMGRKPLLFFELNQNDLSRIAKEAKNKGTIPVIERGESGLIELADSLLEKNVAALDYFLPCQTGALEDKNTILKVNGEIRSVYWKEYPLQLKLSIAISFRVKPGKHHLELRMKNVITGKEYEISKCDIENISAFESVLPFVDDLLVTILTSGIYFINLYIDDQFVACALLFAETNQPEFSYTLPGEALARVSNGELLVLPPRAQHASDSKPLR